MNTNKRGKISINAIRENSWQKYTILQVVFFDFSVESSFAAPEDDKKSLHASRADKPIYVHL
jgi:hypothetical protein